MGTPMGKQDVMKRWNDSITTNATVVGVPPSDTARTSGNVYSITVPPWASAAASREGRRSSG